uniref:Guanylate cyclase domain-containing protein n=1 Tax=Globisporangium ultimum (strain ATCC 200006 / CBS 805.95 / DAOM BR144) TaxID=431595 RepID=K3WD92_GLOUD
MADPSEGVNIRSVEPLVIPAENDSAMAVEEDQRSSAGLRKELDMRLTAYLPAVVRRHLEKQDIRSELKVPDTHQITVVSMFADVSGFTAMTESLAARGPVGAEFLAKHLNSYFEQLLRLVSSAGGDVFKFAGDAMLIFWPENKDDTLESLLRRCVQCALRIQSHLHKAELAPGVVLSVKMGIGIGGATIAHLGGVSDGSISRVEYIAVGPALEQAFSSEHQAEAGEVICSPECWKMINKYFDGEAVRKGSEFYKVKQVNLPIKLCSRRASFTRDDAMLHNRMKQYVSRAVWPYLDAHDEFWGSELRDVTVLFINLGFCAELVISKREADLAKMLDISGLHKLQAAFALVQQCIYEYEGTINKFLVDDKGSTVIAAFGLPPVTHENDPIRGILSSLAICAALGKLDLKASVGITTGTALCGVVGHQGNRREYTVLGDIVNLSARLMQKAKSEKGGVITDETTKIFTQDVLHFEERPEIMVKGKNDSIKIHRPYPRMSTLIEFHMSSTGGARRNLAEGAGNRSHVASRATPMQNVMENMHRVQVRDAQRRLSLRAEEESAMSSSIIESDNFQKVRDSLLEKCSQLNRFSPGGSFILEGDIGVGKTVLLRATLSCPESGSYNVLQGTTTPFETRKPYAIWADMISKCALEQSGVARATSSIIASPRSKASTKLAPQTDDDAVKEAERRKQVALFVRAKIKEGAAPNTTLIGYAKLLNPILDTDLEAYEAQDGDNNGRVSASNQSIKLLEKDVWNNEFIGIRDSSNQDDNTPATNPMDSPTKSKVKEEEIAAWFLGLLEMDLARSPRNSDDHRMLTPIDEGVSARQSAVSSSKDSGSSTTELDAEWTPTDLDLSGILLLCALHAISREKSTVFCLDSAMYMDEKSWILATIIAKYFTNCLVVIGTRPPSLALNENTESSSFRKRLRVLKQMRSSVCQSLEPLCGTETEQLALQILNVREAPNELMTILVTRSQGNPLFLRELIAEMIQQQVVSATFFDAHRKLCE